MAEPTIDETRTEIARQVRDRNVPALLGSIALILTQILATMRAEARGNGPPKPA